MKTEHKKLVTELWEELKKDFYPVKYEVDEEDMEFMGIDEAVSSIKEEYSALYGANYVDTYFEIPVEYLYFSSLLETTYSTNLVDGTWWKRLFESESVFYALQEELTFSEEEIIENIENNHPPMMSIPIGEWSDKHTWFLSCDKNKHFGKVFDCYDETAYSLDEDSIITPSFIDFLKSLLPSK